MEYSKEEVWKDIPGYDGFYQASNRGRVRSWRKYRNNRREQPRILRQDTNTHGYRYVILYRDCEGRHEQVHRLVARSFIPNPLGKPQVNHIDCDTVNNRPENLEWVTNKENSVHAHKNGLIDNRGGKNGQAKLTREEVLEIRSAYDLGCFSYRDFERAYGVSNALISLIINRKRWAHI